PYGRDPEVLLYFLDTHAFSPEPVGKTEDGSRLYGMWVSGSGRADVIVRSERPLRQLTITAESPIRTRFTVSAGGAEASVSMTPGTPARLDVPTSGVRGLNSYAYLLSARSTEGFTPRLRDPASHDDRNLGVLMRFQAVEEQTDVRVKTEN